MSQSRIRNKRSNCVKFATALSIFFLLLASPVQGQIGLRLPTTRPPYVPIPLTKDVSLQTLSTLLDSSSARYPRGWVATMSIDSTGRSIIVTRQMNGLDIQPPQVLSFEAYLHKRLAEEQLSQWLDFVRSHAKPTRRQTRRGGGITFETPKIRSQAFRRVFGGETLSLNVKGNMM